jgi:hypothetical protein
VWGAPTVGKNWSAGGEGEHGVGCQKWFGGSARYMKSECAFNFSCSVSSSRRRTFISRERASRESSREVCCFVLLVVRLVS